MPQVVVSRRGAKAQRASNYFRTYKQLESLCGSLRLCAKQNPKHQAPHPIEAAKLLNTGLQLCIGRLKNMDWADAASYCIAQRRKGAKSL